MIKYFIFDVLISTISEANQRLLDEDNTLVELEGSLDTIKAAFHFE